MRTTVTPLCLVALLIFGWFHSTCSVDAVPPQATVKLDDVFRLEFPKAGYSFTLAEAARGIKISYKIVITRDQPGVIALPTAPSYYEPAGPSGLHPSERITGKNQFYGLIDLGLGPQPKEVPRTFKKGVHVHTFEWDGRNWSGPSDTGRPKGKPFPPGSYDLTVTLHGKLVTDRGKIPYQIRGSTKVTLK